MFTDLARQFQADRGQRAGVAVGTCGMVVALDGHRPLRAHQARGLVVLAVNLDARRADADAFLARQPARFSLAFDAGAESARRFAIKGMPSSALIDRQGLLLFMHRGFRPDDGPALEARIVAALA